MTLICPRIQKNRVFKAEFKDEVTNIVLSGPFSIQSLRSQAKIIKEDLLALGVDKIDIAQIQVKKY